jgi:hypothetical protein
MEDDFERDDASSNGNKIANISELHILFKGFQNFLDFIAQN